MATPKIIPYQVKLRSTTIERSLVRPIVYTNDLRSAEFQFQVTDMQAGELSGATATTLLYMRDGSFFQNPKEDVELTGTTFSYLLKEDEGNHAGIARIQLVVRFNEGLEDEQNFPSQLYDFEIVNGLETQVAQQIMIHDWTTLTREARAYIDEFAANEILREAEFDNNEFDRNAAFNLAQTNRQNQFSDLTEDLTATLAAADANIEEFDVALQNGIVAANLAEKLEDFEEINNSRLLSTERQLEQTDARMDTIIALPEGATTNDARLEDITIGADGVVYPSPGTAVRTQVSDLISDVDFMSAIETIDLLNRYPLEYGSIIPNTGEEVVTTNSFRTGFVPITNWTHELKITLSDYAIYKFTPLFYDSNKQPITTDPRNGQGLSVATNYTNFGSVRYMRFLLQRKVWASMTESEKSNFQMMGKSYLNQLSSEVSALDSEKIEKSTAYTDGSIPVIRGLNVINSGVKTEIGSLLNTDNITKGKTFSGDGKTIVARPTASICTDFIPVTQNKFWTNYEVMIFAFDANEVYLGARQFSANDTVSGITIPAGTEIGLVRLKVESIDDTVLKSIQVFNHFHKNQHFESHRVIPSESIADRKTWYYGKKVATLGDSITEGNTWQPHLSYSLGCKIVNCGIGGTKVSGATANAMWQDARINTIPLDSDVVIIMGGSNDWASNTVIGTFSSVSTDDFYGAYKLMLQKIQARVPNAKVVILTQPHRYQEDTAFALPLNEFRKATEEIGDRYGYPVVKTHRVGINDFNYTTYLSDVVHPNALGGELIANAVYNGLLQLEPIYR